jgi:hypothetical protein
MNEAIEQHPVQVNHDRNKHSKLPKVVTMRAYEVYCHLYGAQEALVTGWCRGGMSVGEITAFLYARTFPKEEWSKRVSEAFKGMENL